MSSKTDSLPHSETQKEKRERKALPTLRASQFFQRTEFRIYNTLVRRTEEIKPSLPVCTWILIRHPHLWREQKVSLC